MDSNTIRQKYLDFFKAREHAVIPSASLVPQNDPTTLFTGSGMQPLVPYLLGKEHPAGARLVDSQKSFRSADIEEIGDNRHTTFFEMLGNWSLGDYFKKEQLPWVFEFLTKELSLDPNRLYVTAYIGDEANGVPRDTESAAIWKELFAGAGIDAKEVLLGTEEAGYENGMQEGRIFYYGDKNWWSRAGAPSKMPAGEPGGPDSEVFYDFGTEHDPKWGTHCHPNCDCGRFLEIGNSVFMQYIKQADGTFAPLPKQNVDFGGGLERMEAAVRNNPDVFMGSAFQALMQAIAADNGIQYAEAAPEQKRAYRIVTDHLRAATFLIADGVLPSNADQGYFVRRLLRRAIRYADKLSITDLAKYVNHLIEYYKGGYINLDSPQHDPVAVIREEEERFRTTLARGLKEFERLSGDNISGTDAFTLFSTYGFPLEMTQELAAERGISVNTADFKIEMAKHQDLSRAGSEQKFKGGLADASEETTRLHTAHHLLLKALQIVLGPHVKQRGSNITSERLRIDFSHDAKMTDEQKKEVERIVNEKIDEQIPVIRTEMAKEEAEKLNAEHEFGAKYPDRVSIYSVGPLDDAFSIEFCGGPHVQNTGELKESGTFKILKEEAVAAGIRRIKAVLS